MRKKSEKYIMRTTECLSHSGSKVFPVRYWSVRTLTGYWKQRKRPWREKIVKPGGPLSMLKICRQNKGSLWGIRMAKPLKPKKNGENGRMENGKRSGHLFQGRFKSFVIENDRYFTAMCLYIHRNPIRAGIVEDLLDYPWSSYLSYVTARKQQWKQWGHIFIYHLRLNRTVILPSISLVTLAFLPIKRSGGYSE